MTTNTLSFYRWLNGKAEMPLAWHQATLSTVRETLFRRLLRAKDEDALKKALQDFQQFYVWICYFAGIFLESPKHRKQAGIYQQQMKKRFQRTTIHLRKRFRKNANVLALIQAMVEKEITEPAHAEFDVLVSSPYEEKGGLFWPVSAKHLSWTDAKIRSRARAEARKRGKNGYFLLWKDKDWQNDATACLDNKSAQVVNKAIHDYYEQNQSMFNIGDAMMNFAFPHRDYQRSVVEMRSVIRQTVQKICDDKPYPHYVHPFITASYLPKANKEKSFAEDVFTWEHSAPRIIKDVFAIDGWQTVDILPMGSNGMMRGFFYHPDRDRHISLWLSPSGMPGGAVLSPISIQNGDYALILALDCDRFKEAHAVMDFQTVQNLCHEVAHVLHFERIQRRCKECPENIFKVEEITTQFFESISNMAESCAKDPAKLAEWADGTGRQKTAAFWRARIQWNHTAAFDWLTEFFMSTAAMMFQADNPGAQQAVAAQLASYGYIKEGIIGNAMQFADARYTMTNENFIYLYNKTVNHSIIRPQKGMTRFNSVAKQMQRWLEETDGSINPKDYKKCLEGMAGTSLHIAFKEGLKSINRQIQRLKKDA